MPEKEKAPVDPSLPGAPLAPYWLPAIVESADDAIISKTLDGIITSWNQAAERMFGFTAEEAIGKPILIIIPEDHRSEETVILSKVRSGQRVDHFETIRQRKDGTLLDVSLTVSPIRTPDGKIIGASKIARDVTEQKRAEQERKRLLGEAEAARREAEAANKSKDEFLALLSHELRTPLHSMKGWISMLKTGMLKDEQRTRALDVIGRGIDAQNALIRDLLDVSRIVAEKLYIEPRRASLVSVVSDTIEQLRPAAIERGVTLEADFDSRADDVTGDPVRLQQIVANLINNGIKYTPDGGHVSIKLARVDHKAELAIVDSGIGIAPELLPRIFDRFAQGDNTSRREYGGLGLGLTIAKRLAELHGGTLTAASEGEGKGASFVLTLPLRAEHPEMARGTPDDATGGFIREDVTELSGKRLLIVEDDLDSLHMLQLILENTGAEVVSVNRSAKAIEELKGSKFDAVISDLGMPMIDGFDLIREIRGPLGFSAAELPAIAISGYAAVDDRVNAIRSGYQMHLAKPLDITLLPQIVKSLFMPDESEVI